MDNEDEVTARKNNNKDSVSSSALSMMMIPFSKLHAIKSVENTSEFAYSGKVRKPETVQIKQTVK